MLIKKGILLCYIYISEILFYEEKNLKKVFLTEKYINKNYNLKTSNQNLYLSFTNLFYCLFIYLIFCDLISWSTL